MWRNKRVLMPRIWFATEAELWQAVGWVQESGVSIQKTTVNVADNLFILEFSGQGLRDSVWEALAHWRTIHSNNSVLCTNCGQSQDDCDCRNGFNKEGPDDEETVYPED